MSTKHVRQRSEESENYKVCEKCTIVTEAMNTPFAVWDAQALRCDSNVSLLNKTKVVPTSDIQVYVSGDVRQFHALSHICVFLLASHCSSRSSLGSALLWHSPLSRSIGAVDRMLLVFQGMQSQLLGYFSCWLSASRIHHVVASYPRSDVKMDARKFRARRNFRSCPETWILHEVCWVVVS